METKLQYDRSFRQVNHCPIQGKKVENTVLIFQSIQGEKEENAFIFQNTS